MHAIATVSPTDYKTHVVPLMKANDIPLYSILRTKEAVRVVIHGEYESQAIKLLVEDAGRHGYTLQR